MKITLNINYHTNWGEYLCVCGSVHELGSNDIRNAKKLDHDGLGNWTLSIELPETAASFTYRYFVKNGSEVVREEYGEAHALRFSKKSKEYVCHDLWQEQPKGKPFFSSAFTQCVNRRKESRSSQSTGVDSIVIRVAAPRITPDQSLAIVGSSPALGQWNPAKAKQMGDSSFPIWQGVIPREALTSDTEYKFIIVNKKDGDVIAWEDGDNRRFGIDTKPGTTTFVTVPQLRNPLPAYRGAGVAIPVFSVRTNEDFGVGDFISLKKMIDWAAMTGQRFLQVLPINDTTMTGTWTDSYPYNANSTFALHPMYMRLEMLGEPTPERKKYYEKLRGELNALPEIDYEKVNRVKSEYIDEMFARNGRKVLATNEFKHFFSKNSHWLRPYAVFCALRDKFNTPEFSMWGPYAHYTSDTVDNFIAESEENAQAVRRVYYIQFNLDKQMREVSEYASAKGVAIKGDIPIGISRTSVDAWVDTRLFNMDCQAGAPPDDFSVLGQNWGFPTYNWEEMNKDGFAWWKARFRKMAEYFDAYRIDHVLGFFRIWQIPMDALHGLLGVFNPALPYTQEEMRDYYDFWFDRDLYTRPYIMDYMLGDFFGEYTDEVRDHFLIHTGYGRYNLREEFSTQRKVADFFATQPKDDKNNKICNGLLGLIDDVLFIEDPVEKGKYHPRISAQFTYIYRSLNDYERSCFDRLYNDFFYHRHNDFWYGKAMWKLPPLIDATNMLVCAEDLGMIPACVPAVMDRLEILALEIQRMPKDPKQEFGDTWHYPYYSVCTTSTHDMGGIRSWWEEDREATQRYYNNVLGLYGEAPYFAEPWICAKILEYHFRSPSMLCIIPLADLLSMDGALRRNDPREETINVPANPRHYWRYRMHLTVEQLLCSSEYNNQLSVMLKQAGRN